MLDKYILQFNNTINQALHKLNGLSGEVDQVIFIVDEKKSLLGSLSDGDIRRAFINGFSTEDEVSKVMFENCTFLIEGYYSVTDIKKIKNKS